jgi:RNA polymerase sigma factor (sigma-70 family)
MGTAALAGLTGLLARDPRSDGDLVREYAATGSEAAFAELVRRFAPMVWAVCRRTVGDHQYAEDAFQAAFVVLVRKAGSIRPPSAVGGWLHAVAVHTATRARTAADRRRKRHPPLATDPACPTPVEPTDPATLRALDEEVARLPDHLRVAVTLCELGGVSRREAAGRLGIAEGTLSSRLAAARKTLAARLRGRGVALAAALALGPAVEAAPPVSAPTSELSITLADGAIRTMFLTRVRRSVAVAVALAVGAVGAVAVAAPPAHAADRHPIKAPVPKAADSQGKILFWLDERPLFLTPDGAELPSPDPIPKVHRNGSGDARLSPDGKRLAYQFRDSNHEGWLRIVDIDRKAEPTTLDAVRLNGFHWLGDGKTVYVRGYPAKGGGKLADWVYDPAGDKLTPLAVPKDFFVRAISPDGKTAVADEWKMAPARWHQHAHLWALGSDDQPTPLLERNQSFKNLTPRFSADGGRLLCRVHAAGPYTPNKDGTFDDSEFEFDNLLVIDLKTKKQTVVKEVGHKPEWRVCGYAWSPDGERVAYVEYQPPRPPAREDQFRVTVADADGRNAKEILAAKGACLVGFDWR